MSRPEEGWQCTLMDYFQSGRRLLRRILCSKCLKRSEAATVVLMCAFNIAGTEEESMALLSTSVMCGSPGVAKKRKSRCEKTLRCHFVTGVRGREHGPCQIRDHPRGAGSDANTEMWSKKGV